MFVSKKPTELGTERCPNRLFIKEIINRVVSMKW